MKKISKKARKNSLLPSISREYSLYEIAIATRAGQAKALGLKQKGHLGIGADADIAIYNLNPEVVDLSKKFKTLRRAFKKAAYTIKDGEIVVKDGEIVKSVEGKTFWVNVKTKAPAEVNADMKRRFRDYWTVEYENYPVSEKYLAISAPVSVKAAI